jgi:nitrite reductase/ring-hydroxylating ferredoxin subunit
VGTKIIKVCDASDVEPDSHTQVRVEGLGPLAVYHVDGEFYVTDDTCTHMHASLGEEGSLEGHVIQCTWHNGKFDIRTGAVLGPPCVAPLKTYPVILRDGTVFIEFRND